MLSNEELLTKLNHLVHSEREILTEVLNLLMQVEDRKLHLNEGYSSLFDYCVHSLNYSEAQAFRRISAMRLMRELPELKPQIQSGGLKLSQLTQAKKFFADQMKKNAPSNKQAESNTHENNAFIPQSNASSAGALPLSKEQKLDLLNSLANKSSRDTEKFFAELNPQSAPPDKTRSITAQITEIKFSASETLMKKIEQFKNLNAHTLPSPNYNELFEHLIDLALAQTQKKKSMPQEKGSDLLSTSKVNKTKRIKIQATTIKATAVESEVTEAKSSRTEAASLNSLNCKTDECMTNERNSKFISPTQNTLTQNKNENEMPKTSRYIPVWVKNEVRERDQNTCSFLNPTTGKRCNSKYKLQFDHVRAFAKGGENTASNIRLLCQNHNLLMAEKEFGQDHIRKFIKKSNGKINTQEELSLSGGNTVH